MIIFDCDGVLVDSEALVIGIEARLLSEAGFSITEDEIAERFVGLPYSTMLETIGQERDQPVPSHLRQTIERQALEEISERLTAVSGIEQVLAVLDRQGMARCVASSSDLRRIRLSLRSAGLEAFFRPETVFSASMVARGKPAPDLFLHAAKCCGVEARSCVVVEDSPYGVQAARSAGMRAIGFLAAGHVRPALEDRLREAGAAEISHTSDDLLAALVPARFVK